MARFQTPTSVQLLVWSMRILNLFWKVKTSDPRTPLGVMLELLNLRSSFLSNRGTRRRGSEPYASLMFSISWAHETLRLCSLKKQVRVKNQQNGLEINPTTHGSKFLNVEIQVLMDFLPHPGRNIHNINVFNQMPGIHNFDDILISLWSFWLINEVLILSLSSVTSHFLDQTEGFVG